MANKISVTVNGKSCTGEVESRTLLSDYLREDLSMTGTHIGCDTSSCGACTVHVDGTAMRSCSLTLSQIDGKSITTILMS